MTQFLGTPKVQYTDASGEPLASGKLYSYEPGTETDKATYPTISDADSETNANANPVVLNSRGEANVVLKGSTKLVLKDSDDNTIWTVDNISESVNLVDSNGNTIVELGATASAVNYFTISNAASGGSPTIAATGSDSNIGIILSGKAGEVELDSVSLLLDDAEGILNSSSEVSLRFQKVTDAVNYFDLYNSDAGTNLKLAAEGSDGSVGISFQTKGTGTFNFLSTSDTSAIFKTYENTDNGSNYLQWDIPASITSNKAIVLPDASGVLATIPATQSAVANETDEDTYVTPDLVKYSPWVAKAWVRFSGGVGPTIQDSYNVSSVVRNAQGLYTVNLTNSLSASTSYAVMVTPESSSSAVTSYASYGSRSSSAVAFFSRVGAGQADASYYNVLILGDF